MTKRKIILLVSMLCMVAILGIGGTLAYFNDEESAENVFTVGNVDIELDEPKWEEGGEKEAEDAYPGEALAKDPQVKNAGKNPCFVRISVTGLDQFVSEYGEEGMIGTRYQYVNGYNTADWVKYGDYYYYYTGAEDAKTGVLAIGETTKPVFDQIVMPVCLENNEKTESIIVKAEAVQAQGAKPSFADVQKMTVAEIAAWFDQAFAAEQK